MQVTHINSSVTFPGLLLREGMEVCLKKIRQIFQARQTDKHYTGLRAFAGGVRGYTLPTGSSCRCHMPAELELLPAKTPPLFLLLGQFRIS